MGPCGAPVMELMADGSRDDGWMVRVLIVVMRSSGATGLEWSSGASGWPSGR